MYVNKQDHYSRSLGAGEHSFSGRRCIIMKTICCIKKNNNNNRLA